MVIATEKKLPSVLIDETSLQKILMLTENIAIVSARHELITPRYGFCGWRTPPAAGCLAAAPPHGRLPAGLAWRRLGAATHCLLV